jgi:hypothetical protein
VLSEALPLRIGPADEVVVHDGGRDTRPLRQLLDEVVDPTGEAHLTQELEAHDAWVAWLVPAVVIDTAKFKHTWCLFGGASFTQCLLLCGVPPDELLLCGVPTYLAS